MIFRTPAIRPRMHWRYNVGIPVLVVDRPSTVGLVRQAVKLSRFPVMCPAVDEESRFRGLVRLIPVKEYKVLRRLLLLPRVLPRMDGIWCAEGQCFIRVLVLDPEAELAPDDSFRVVPKLTLTSPTGDLVVGPTDKERRVDMTIGATSRTGEGTE